MRPLPIADNPVGVRGQPGEQRPEPGRSARHRPSRHRLAPTSVVRRLVRAYDVNRMLSRDGRPTPLGDAIAHYGRIAKSLRILRLADEPGYRRQIKVKANLQEGGQINDPAKGAAAIYTAVTAEHPPARLQIGPDAIAMAEAKLTRVRDELETWRNLRLGSSTLFADPADSRSAQVPVVSTISSAVEAVPTRNSRTRRTVLDATAALMAEGGLTATTVDAIRDRSGVSKDSHLMTA